MKKILSILVAVSLLMAIAIPAFAGEKVDALTDAQQKEIATLILESIEKGNDVETAMGRSNIKQDVVSGIGDLTPYKTAYRANPDSVKLTVSLAVTAVKDDVAFSSSAAGMLTALISKAITDAVSPSEPVTGEPDDNNDNNLPVGSDREIDYYVNALSGLNYSQKESVLVSLVGNGVLTVDKAELIIKNLYKNGSVTLEERNNLITAVNSQEATTNSVEGFFQGYTPTDLSQLFRGFGDAISYITSGLADLLRSTVTTDPDNPDNPNNSDNSNQSGDGTNTTPSNPTDIPPTGDYAVASVAAIAAIAGLALVLTKKKKDN